MTSKRAPLSLTDKFNALAADLSVSPLFLKTLTGDIESQQGVQRVDMLTDIVDCLSGTYNAFGMRRWLDRPRTELNGQTPRDILHNDWNPRAKGPRAVLKLARSLKQ